MQPYLQPDIPVRGKQLESLFGALVEGLKKKIEVELKKQDLW